MDVVIEKFGFVIFSFFFLSMAVETLLENFRWVLSYFGITLLQSKGTLESALAEAADFVPERSRAQARFVAMADMVIKQSATGAEVSAKLEKLKSELMAAASEEARDAVVAQAGAWLANAAAPIRAGLEHSESKRVLLLRLISMVLGVGIAVIAHFDVFEMVAESSDGELSPTKPWLGYIAVGLAAAGGSSYWHDWLDKVRKLKDISAQLAVLKT